MSDTATLDVLIQIREELAGLARTRTGFEATTEAAAQLSSRLDTVTAAGKETGASLVAAMRDSKAATEALAESMRAGLKDSTIAAREIGTMLQTSLERGRIEANHMGEELWMQLVQGQEQAEKLGLNLWEELVASREQASALGTELVSALKRSTAETDDLARASARARAEQNGFAAAVRQGLGIGSGIEIARNAVAMLKNSFMATVGEAFRLSGEIRDQAEALSMTREAYQVYAYELSKGAVEASRLTMAFSEQKSSMADARDEASQAAAAYRGLGLDLAAIEAMPFEQRLEAIVRATLSAKDETLAYQQAGVLLGTRGLPQLLSALRGVAKDGYGAVAQAARDAGLVMSDDTSARLDAAEKTIARFKQRLTIGTGEILAASGSFLDAFRQDFWGTTVDIMSGMGGAINPSLWARLGGVAKPEANPNALNTNAPLPLAQTTAWRTAELDLLKAQNREQIQAAQLIDSEATKRRLLVGTLEAQAAAQSRLLALATERPLAATETQAERDKLIEQLRMQVSLLNARKLAAEIGPIGRAETATLNYRNINNRDENPDYMDGFQGLRVGAQEFLTGLGSMGQQTASILQGSLGAALNSIGNDIWQAMKGTQEWGQMFTNLGDIAGRMLTQIITQMIVMKTLNMALGLFGFGITGNTGATISKLPATPVVGAVTNAGGGEFLTRGPTSLIVGDNPGGVEHVSVTPLSGVGTSTYKGNVMRMAGGGMLKAAGAGVAAGLSIVVNQTLNVSAGVAQTVRAEMMEMMPAFRELAVDAVSEAAARGQFA